jgi:hypothetical protein
MFFRFTLLIIPSLLHEVRDSPDQAARRSYIRGFIPDPAHG